MLPQASDARSASLFQPDDEPAHNEQVPRKQAQKKAAPPPPERVKGGRFARGVSGNPNGRPLGSRNKTTEIAAQLVAGDVVAVMKKCLGMAKAGDRVALRLVVERLLPRASLERRVEADLPRVRKATDIAAAMGEIVARVADGSMSLEEARQFGALLEVQRKAIETSELQVRIEALEAAKEREDMQQ